MTNTTTPPTLVEYLVEEYIQAMHTRNAELAKAHTGQAGAPPQIDVEHHIRLVSHFRQFAEEFLEKHRPARLEHADANYIIQLTNKAMVLVSPGTTIKPGSMQPAHAIPVTGRQYVGELDFGDGIPLNRPAAARLPVGMTDMTQPNPAQDMTLPQASRSYGQ